MKNGIAQIIQDEINSRISDKPRKLYLNEEESFLIDEYFERIPLKKADSLDNYTNNSAKYLYFVEEGLLCFWSNRNIIIDFVQSNTFLLSYMEVGCHIEALEESVVWRVDNNILLTIFMKSTNINTLVNFIFEKLLVEQMNRILFITNMKPEERYMEIIEKKKYLFQSVPLKHLASYIGVTPQALSRIRKRCIHK